MKVKKKLSLNLVETENFSVGQDWEVPIPAFLILSAKRKIRSIAEFTDIESVEFINLLKKVRILMSDMLQIRDVYFFQNEDTEHGFHLWIFPRYKWMEKFGIKIESVRLIMNFAKESMWTEENLLEIKNAVEKLKENL